MNARDETNETRANRGAIEAYLAALASKLTVEPAERATILEEARGHLEEAAAAGVARGAAPAEAEARAVAAFGPARETARAFNAALPVYWDTRRMLLGIGQGALAIWVVWTLATFPFVVHMAFEPQFDRFTSPAALLFSASPLGFGLFYTLPNGPWAALLILALFGAIAFALGSRASGGGRAGLAFGLGVIVGMPFLPISLLPLRQGFISWTALPAVLTIWLLAPYAVFAARLGARFVHVREGCRMRVAALPASRRRRVSPAVVVGLIALVVLLGLNGWSFARALTPDPAAAARVASQQLAAAQAELPFTIRQPGYVPDGMALSHVTPAVSGCNPCVGYNVVILKYRDAHDGWIELTEQPHSLSAAPATPDYTYSAGPLYSNFQDWWLGAGVQTEQEATLVWSDGALDYTVSTNTQKSRPELERIARSIPR